MPAGDGTGPRSEGPMTGRAAGRCAGYPDPGYSTAPGRGGGRGRRTRSFDNPRTRQQRYPRYAPQVVDQGPSEAESLRSRILFVAETIEEIAFRVNQLLKRRAEKE